MSDELAVCEASDCSNEFQRFPANKKYCSTDCKRTVENASRRRQLVDDVVAAVAPMYVDEDQRQDFLKKELQRLQRENLKLKNVKQHQIETIYEAVTEGLKEIEFKEVSAPTLTKMGDEEVAVAILSDLQLAKKTPTYNSKVCEERMELYAEKIRRITEIQRSEHDVNKLHVWLLGDIIEGQGIFAGQQFLVDAGFYRQITIDGPRILGNFLREMLSIFESVRVVGVIGNHGRIANRDEFDPESNGDRMLYRILELMFENQPRLSWEIPDGIGERHWYAVDTIGKYRSLLCHGDQFNSFGSFYTIGRKVLGWKAGAIEEPWDDIAIGHFHQSTKLSFGSTTLRVNGTVESSNTYAQERLASVSVPSQHLMYVHPKKGIVTAEYDIRLDIK